MHTSVISSLSTGRGHRRWEGDCDDHQFTELMQALRGHGGMLPIEGVRAVSSLCSQDISVSQYLAQNKLFFIIWRRQYWMPCFQFEPATWTPCPLVSSLVEHLRPTMSGTTIALWFIRKDRFLKARAPIDLLQTDADRVREFARQSGFYARGEPRGGRIGERQ